MVSFAAAASLALRIGREKEARDALQAVVKMFGLLAEAFSCSRNQEDDIEPICEFTYPLTAKDVDGIDEESKFVLMVYEKRHLTPDRQPSKKAKVAFLLYQAAQAINFSAADNVGLRIIALSSLELLTCWCHLHVAWNAECISVFATALHSFEDHSI